MDKKKPNVFVRLLIVLLSIGIIVLIAYNVFWIEPKGELNPGVFTLIAFLIVLVLSESFDNFSVGKLITISREVQKKEKENKELERKNDQLLNQVLTISNTQQQNQSHTNVYGDFYGDSKKSIQNTEGGENQVQELLDVIGNSPFIQEIERSIIQDLVDRNLPHDTATDRILIRHLAGSNIVLDFERIYNLIFGSQIQLLKELNAKTPNGKQEIDVFKGIDKVLYQYREQLSEWTHEIYLGYLYNSTLIMKNDENIIHISVKGVEFLTWLVRNGLREDKPF
jgi:hypothetical protein